MAKVDTIGKLLENEDEKRSKYEKKGFYDGPQDRQNKNGG